MCEVHHVRGRHGVKLTGLWGSNMIGAHTVPIVFALFHNRSFVLNQFAFFPWVVLCSHGVSAKWARAHTPSRGFCYTFTSLLHACWSCFVLQDNVATTRRNVHIDLLAPGRTYRGCLLPGSDGIELRWPRRGGLLFSSHIRARLLCSQV